MSHDIYGRFPHMRALGFDGFCQYGTRSVHSRCFTFPSLRIRLWDNLIRRTYTYVYTPTRYIFAYIRWFMVFPWLRYYRSSLYGYVSLIRWLLWLFHPYRHLVSIYYVCCIYIHGKICSRFVGTPSSKGNTYQNQINKNRTEGIGKCVTRYNIAIKSKPRRNDNKGNKEIKHSTK